MIIVEDYIKLSREERRAHLRLDSPCVIRGGDSFQMRGLLAHTLDTTIPIPKNGKMVQVCHACHNSACGNPFHLYWGSYRDNMIDKVENGSYISPYHDAVKKHGVEYANSRNRRSSESAKLSAMGLIGTKKSPEHRLRISEGLRKAHQKRISENK
jgi:hypothetical protein